MTIEPIEDVSSEDSYISDLETEVESLRAQVKKLNKTKKPKPQIDTNCCDAYKTLLVSFHRLIDDILPF